MFGVDIPIFLIAPASSPAYATAKYWAVVVADGESIMAHKRKDTFTAPPEWWKHLRPFNKRRVSKKERDAAKREISRAALLGSRQSETP